MCGLQKPEGFMEKSEFNPGNIRVSRILFGLGIICVLHLCQPARGE